MERIVVDTEDVLVSTKNVTVIRDGRALVVKILIVPVFLIVTVRAGVTAA